MSRFTTGWFKPKHRKPLKPMSFLFVVFCSTCKGLSSVSRHGRPCPKCGAGPDSLVLADGWDFDKTGILDLHLGKVATHE